jgi:hypothetical protein
MAAAPGAAALPITAPPALSPPAVPHVFTRVTLPGEDNTLDYVAVSAATAVVRGLPLLGWVDSSAVQANTRAAPLLSVAGCVCLSTYVEDKSSPVGRALLALSELLAVPTLVLLGRCADACESLRMFAVPLTNYDDWVDKLKPALARIPHPSPFILGGGELVEANVFATPAIPAVAAVAAIAAVPAVRRNRAQGIVGVPAIRAVPAIPGRAAVPASSPPDLLWWSLVPLSSSYDEDLLPLASFWRRGMAAPDRTSVTARSDPASRVQAISSILYRHLGSILHDRKASHAQRARAMLHSGDQLQTLPASLRAGVFHSAGLESELADDFAYSQGAERHARARRHGRHGGRSAHR